MGKSGDLYDVLGVTGDASPQEIKRAFRAKARTLHPDVAGDDPAKAEAFKRVREAYETLSDPAARARYDRRGEPRTSPFYGSMWNRGTVNVGAPPASANTRAAGNDLDLEDIFNDFSGVGDFGFTGSTRGQPGRPKPAGPAAGRAAGARAAGARAAEPSRSHRPEPGDPMGGGRGAPPGPSGGGVTPDASSAPRGARPERSPGRDIPLAVDVPPQVAVAGGTVTVTYVRLRRADDGHTLYRYDELHDLKVPPGTRHGDTLRVPRMGDAGMEGGAYGDLVVDIRVPGARAAEPRGEAWDPDREGAAFEHGGRAEAGGPVDPGSASAQRAGARETSRESGGKPRDSGRMRMPGHEGTTWTNDGAVRVDVHVVTALLGGRVAVPTPGGTVRVNVPPGTSSGTRMRLRGRGPAGADGTPGDLVAELRIVVPKVLDDASRELIERFAVRNPPPEE
jgi:molecular chaperone DnaJ